VKKSGLCYLCFSSDFLIEEADEWLSALSLIRTKHKFIAAQPLVEKISIGKYLGDAEPVVAGGEADRDGRILDYDWILALREECVRANVSFTFRQAATHFVRDGVVYTLPWRLLFSQARKAGIDFRAEGMSLSY
jgi:Bacteriophage protein gp37